MLCLQERAGIMSSKSKNSGGPKKIKKQSLETCSNNEEVDKNEETYNVPTIDERKRIREAKVQKMPTKSKRILKFLCNIKKSCRVLKRKYYSNRMTDIKTRLKPLLLRCRTNNTELDAR